MSSPYTTGSDVDRVLAAVERLLGDGGYDVELADDYPGYSIAIDILAVGSPGSSAGHSRMPDPSVGVR